MSTLAAVTGFRHRHLPAECSAWGKAAEEELEPVLWSMGGLKSMSLGLVMDAHNPALSEGKKWKHDKTKCGVCHDHFIPEERRRKYSAGDPARKAWLRDEGTQPRLYELRGQNDTPVCMDIRRLPCGHCFHAECISDWVQDGMHKCPNCKMDLRPLFKTGGAFASDGDI